MTLKAKISTCKHIQPACKCANVKLICHPIFIVIIQNRIN